MLKYTWWYMEKYQEQYAKLLMKFLMGCLVRLNAKYAAMSRHVEYEHGTNKIRQRKETCSGNPCL